MLKYKAIIADNKDFDAKIIQPMKDNIKQGAEMSWLKDADKFYSMDMLSYILKNAYNERYIRYDTEEEFIGYFANIFLTVTPMFYAKISNIIEDKFQELQDNTNVGIKTNITSESDRGTSGRAFDNALGDDKQTETEKSKYVMDSRSDNLLDNAKKLSQSKISGEITLYVASFAELFSTLDVEDAMDTSFTPALIAILSDIAMVVTTLGHTEVSDGQGGFVNLIDFKGRLMTEQSVSDDITNAIKRYDESLKTTILTPLTNRVNHIGDNQIIQEDGSEIGFDDDTPQKVYSEKGTIKAIKDNETIKDLTHLTTQDEIYKAIETGGWYKVKVTAAETAIVTCTYKPATQAYLTGLSSDETYGLSAKMVYTIIRVGNTTPITYSNSPTVIGEPRADNNATTKKYVDAIKYKPTKTTYKTGQLDDGQITSFILNANRNGNIVTYHSSDSGLNGSISYNSNTIEFYIGNTKLNDLSLSNSSFITITNL